MNADEESKSNAGRWVIAVSVVLVLYALSYGPVFALVEKYKISDTRTEMITVFYKPLWLGMEQLGMEKYMFDYFCWWCKILHVQLYDP